ncbi:ABC transporter substrate-binding protein [Alicyclobacillus pomorum]|jgi:NitT/TauT family transport system substrate-binding protein|uniref:ABC transporter substrate-binding protein n=1 Tax=Alicyclobacillus pomorum TaxID=204470 RepID=UPI00040695B0|nr:ABC transporter substrate-binding protein [Alicyclobacillus pomorum]
MKLRFKLSTGIAAISAFALLVTGCGTNSSPTSDAKTSNSGGSSSSAPTIKIMVGGMSKIIYLPAELTARLGYFKQEGLNVQLLDETAGVSAEDELVSGQVDGVVGFYDHIIDLQAKGKNLVDVVQLNATPGERLMVVNSEKNQIKTLADLKGKKIGVTDLGSSTNFLASYLVVKGGNSASSYTPVPVGAGQTLIAAMQQGRIDAAVTTEPTVSLLEQKNLAFPLVDMASVDAMNKVLGGTYPASCFYMKADYVQAHPDVVQKLADAFVKTMQYIHTHTPEQIADQLPSEYYAGNKQMYLMALTKSMPMFTPDGKMPTNGPETVLNVLTAFNPQLKHANINLSATYTTQFVDKALQGH